MLGEEYWDGIAPKYDSLYQDPWSQYEDALTARVIRRELGRAPGHRVLDIGCGMGLAYDLLRADGANVDYTGLDISPAMLERLRTRLPGVKAVCGPAEEVLSTLAGPTFDLILAINTSASFPAGTMALLRSIKQLLSPDGRYSLSFLNRYALRRLLRFENGTIEIYRTRGDRSPSGGVRAVTMVASEFIAMAQQCGLQNESVEFQSVLGGVLEVRSLISLERVLVHLAPLLGHSITFSGTSGR